MTTGTVEMTAGAVEMTAGAVEMTAGAVQMTAGVVQMTAVVVNLGDGGEQASSISSWRQRTHPWKSMAVREGSSVSMG